MAVDDYLINNVKSLIVSHGWMDLGPQKNPYLFSFKCEKTKARLNLAYTTMTVTLQQKKGRFTKIFKACSIEDLQSILLTGNIK